MKLTTAVLAAVIAGPALPASVPALDFHPLLLQYSRADDAIIRSFRSVARRAPTERELVRYRALMIRYGWTEQDVRSDLAERTDYYRSSNRRLRPDAAIRSAYQDVLGRDPDAEGLRHYRERIRREGWTEQDIREALRNSEEYRADAFRTASADRIIRRAYLDVLRREPDAEGLQAYRREVLENGWEYHDVRTALARSTERRQNRSAISEAQAAEVVRRAYLSVLGREPDQEGWREYTAKLRHEGWTEAQLIQSLRNSDEYRNRPR